jgi:hypothetical protein
MAVLAVAGFRDISTITINVPPIRKRLIVLLPMNVMRRNDTEALAAAGSPNE